MINSDQNARWILTTTAISGFMSALDSSIVNLIMPNLCKYFNTSISTIEWTTMAYLLVISCLVLTFGRLGDIYGHKKIYLLGYIFFISGSLLCSLASSVWVLIVFRMFQAIGASMLLAVSTAIITLAVSAQSRGKALSISAIAMGSATVMGPILGGFLATIFGWRSIFFINIPIGLIGLWIAERFIPCQSERSNQSFDLGGAGLLLVSLIVILLPLSLVEKLGWKNPMLLTSFGIGLCFIIIFILFERRTVNPLLELDLFHNRLFSLGTLSTLLSFMAQFTIVLVVPFYLLDLQGLSPTQAGMLFLPMPITIILVAPLSGILSDQMDSRYISSAGMGMMTLGMWQLSNLTANSNNIVLTIALITAGLGHGLFHTSNNSAVMGSVTKRKRGVASGMLAMMRNIGMILGIGISTAIFTSTRDWLTVALKSQGFSGLLLTQMAFERALHITCLAGAIFAFAAVFTSLIKGSTRREVNNL